MRSIVPYLLLGASLTAVSPRFAQAKPPLPVAPASGSSEQAQLSGLGAQGPGLLTQTAGERVIVEERVVEERPRGWHRGYGYGYGGGYHYGPGSFILTVLLVTLLVLILV